MIMTQCATSTKGQEQNSPGGIRTPRRDGRRWAEVLGRPIRSQEPSDLAFARTFAGKEGMVEQLASQSPVAADLRDTVAQGEPTSLRQHFGTEEVERVGVGRADTEKAGVPETKPRDTLRKEH